MAQPIAGITPAQFGQQAGTASQSIETIFSNITSLEEGIADTTRSIGYVDKNGNTASMLLTKNLGDLAAQQKKQEIAAAADWDRLSIELGRDLGSLAESQRSLTQTIVEKSAVSLFDDPLQALANAFTMPWDKQALEGVTSKIKETRTAMEAVNSHIQVSAKTADDIKTTITAADIAEQQTILSRVSGMQADAAKVVALKSNAAGVKSVLEMNKEQMGAYVQARQLANSDAQLAISKANEARQAEIFKFNMDKIKDEKAAEATQLSLVNLALTSDGKNPIDITRLKNYKATSAKWVDALLESGLRLATNPKASTGDNVIEQINYRNLTGAVPTTEVGKRIVEMQEEAYTKAAATGTKDKGALAIATDKNFRELVNSYAKNIRTGDQTNPFVAQAYSTLAASPSVANDPLWKKYIAPTITESNKNSPVDPQRVFSALMDGVVKNEVSLNQAADFYAGIYQKSNALNNEVNRLPRVAGVEQLTYNTKLQVRGTTAEVLSTVNAATPLTGAVTAAVSIAANLATPEVKVNAADPVSVRNAMAKALTIKSGFVNNPGTLFQVNNYEIGPGAKGEYPEGWKFERDGIYPPPSTYLQKKKSGVK